VVRILLYVIWHMTSTMVLYCLHYWNQLLAKNLWVLQFTMFFKKY